MLKLSGKAVAIGTFDGLHKGHMALVEALVPPAVLFAIGDDGPKLMQPEIRKKILNVGLIEQELTPEFKNLTPDDFFDTYLADTKLVVVGFNFRYGKNREGDVETLQRTGKNVVVIPPVTYKGEIISSSRIRECITKGEMIEVLSMLGRPYMICGDVARGAGLGGTWGISTANIRVPENLILPPEGVYVTLAEIDGRYYPAVTNYGSRPTVGRDEKAIETHIIDYNDAIYGNSVTVHFYKKIREIQKYNDVEALKARINKDILYAREFFLYKKQNLC